MKEIKKYILSQLAAKKLTKAEAVKLLKELQGVEPKVNQDIAVIGLSCRLPMANNAEAFWDNLIQGRNCFVAKPTCKKHGEQVIGNPLYADLFEVEPFHKGQENLEEYVSPYIEDIDRFDARFFNILPREAQCIDPAQRVFLELAWAAIEDAGYSMDQIKDTLTGVYVGKDYSNPSYYRLITQPDPLKSTGTWEGFLASRLNYFLNLRGPSMVVDTACSSGMVALHLACHALRNGECEMALVGGVAIGCGGEAKKEGELSAVGAVSSKDNCVRTFDDKCSGSVFGEGVVAVVLKPLKAALLDQDHVYGVIKGSAINNDGTSSGISAPNPLAQEALIVQAWKNAEVNPETIQYIEAHGTGTKLGDPIEISGLDNAFRKYSRKRQFCGIGSVKTNIGHLVAASGLAGLVKVLLSLEHEMIPPSLNFSEPNRHIDFCRSALYVVDRPTPWKQSDTPRRAGINSFGMSGTNCHVIVEQAPPRLDVPPSEKPEIVCFSAKTKESLRGLLEDYRDFLPRHRQLSIRDIAYTANTGRGHYTWRAAMIVRSEEQLETSIQLLLDRGLSDFEEEGIFCGEHKIVADGRSSYAQGELTEAQAVEYTKQAESAADNLPLLCKCYTKGAFLDWKSLYPAGSGRRIPLPAYHFERTLCWAEPKKAPEFRQTAASLCSHVECCLAKSKELLIYSLRFCLDKDWVLQEHKIAGSNLVPGTVYIDILTQLCRRLWDAPLCLDTLVFYTPLVVQEGAKEAQLILRKEKDGWQIQILSCEQDDWSVHCEGRFHLIPPSDQTVDVDQFLRSRGAAHQIDVTENDGETAVGPRWNCCKALHSDLDGYLLELELPGEYAADIERYAYHPAMADVAVNLAAQFNYHSNLYLPLQYKNLQIYRPLPARFYCRFRPLASSGKETFSFSVCMFDEMGKILAQAEEYTTKRVEQYQTFFANHFYQVDWEQTEAGESGSVPHVVALFQKGDNSPLEEGLRNAGCQILHVTPGKSFLQSDESHFTVSSSTESYAQLLSALSAKGCQHLIHAWNLEPNLIPNEGIWSVFYLAKAAGMQTERFHVLLLAQNAQKITGEEPFLQPDAAAFLSMAKCVPDELSCMTVQAVDVDEPDSPRLLQELFRKCSHRVRAIRRETVYTPILRQLPPSEGTAFAPEKDSVYLIAGGSGGLGLELAKWLAQKGAACLHLLGRRPLDEKGDSKQKRLWDTVESLREKCRVCYHTIDVTDTGAMGKLGQLLQQEGRLDGIFQCAGAAGNGMLLNKEESTFRSVLEPKMQGTWNLHRLPVNPKYFVLFSSVQTLFGGAGQCDYTAANSFLDAFADYRHMLGLPATAINWPAWKQTGMAVDMGAALGPSFFHALSSDRAIAALETALAEKLSGVIPGKLDTGFLSQELAHFPIALEQKLLPQKTTKDRAGENTPKTLLLRGKESGDFTQREREVAQLYAQTIGLTEIDVFDSINAMGGDSIVSMEILKALNHQYGNRLSAADMFTYASVHAMAAHIEELLLSV